MKALLAQVEAQYQKQLPFVVFRKPHVSQVKAYLQSDASRYTTADFQDAGFVFTTFDGTNNYCIPAKTAQVLEAKFEALNATLFSVDVSFSDSLKVDFEARVSKAVSRIQLGDFEKVVLSRKELVAWPEVTFSAIINRLFSLYPTAFCYAWFHPETGLWMGASPEQLVKIQGETLHSIALAGTQKYTDNPSWGAKEKQEQQVVTDYLVAQLQPFCEHLELTGPYTQQAGALLHLKTEIKAQLHAGFSLQNLLHTLHPTPAICGMPKAAALQFIGQEEGYDRQFYSGFLGEICPNNQVDLFVNLRCMQRVHEQAHIYVGCGITSGSVPNLEFVETVHKLQTMKQVLAQ
ncbi:MAG: chorismate-binding protein [Flavobacterium sp.]|jgi:isochorismate synthase